MYKCNDCGNLFEDGEEKTYSENVGEAWGLPVNDEWTGCPICGGGYEIVKPCRICGSYVGIQDDETACEECKKKILKRFNNVVSELFTADERKILNEMLDGKEI